LRDLLRVYGLPILVIVVGVIVALQFVEPPPPRRVVVAGGGAGGAYALTAQHYAETLRAQKIEVEVLTTAGSVDNLARVKAGEADIGIVQTGLAADLGADGVKSLGAMFFEPLWVFHRASVPVADLRDLRGRRVAIGAEGSGVRVLASVLLEEAGVTAADFASAPLSGADAAASLRAGEIDVAMVVAGPTADWIAALMADPAVSLLSMRRAPALARRHSYLDEVVLYAGVLDPARGLPAEDVKLIAPAAQLVVRDGLHPAIQSLLMDAALAEHGDGTLLTEPGQFPTPVLSDLPISREAERYYENGPSFLRRIFPYAVANFLERAWVLAIPLVTLLIPLIRAAPPLYRWRIRRKIYVWYRDLRDYEAAGRTASTPEERTEVRNKLSDLQAQTGEVQVPLSYTDDLYRLRAHIRFVSELIEKLSAQDKHARI
jgi:TRAP transporter TAXI family solute receptor